MSEEVTKKGGKSNIGEMFSWLKKFLIDRFDLTEDQASQEEVEDNIRRNIDFKGSNLWILMFAIVVASIGLNVNSTAVIIGAMLISPLMGPILGVGLSLSISDFTLLNRSLRNLSVAVLISLLVSTLYFMISPLTIAQSELLSRTSPTIWDVLIATFGGLTGIVAQSRKDRSSPVIPGVAIATALMPPLCTAGFGIASGEWQYFLGAIYLFSINAVFIALSCFVVANLVMKFKPHTLRDSRETNRVNRAMALVAVVMIVPSCIMAYGIVQKTIFETNASQYLSKVFSFEKSEVVNTTITYDPRGEGNRIDIVIVGEVLSSDAIDMATNQLDTYSLEGTKLVVRQANSSDKVDNATFSKLLKSNAEIIEEKNNRIERLQLELSKFSRDTIPSTSIAMELTALWSNVAGVELSRTAAISSEGKSSVGRLICVLKLYGTDFVPEDEQQRLKSWLSYRTNTSDVMLIVERVNLVEVSPTEVGEEANEAETEEVAEGITEDIAGEIPADPMADSIEIKSRKSAKSKLVSLFEKVFN